MTSRSNNFFWNLLGTASYAFTSLFFLITVTRLNGINEAGLFSFAFSNACVLQVLGLYYGRPFQVTERNKTLTEGTFFVNRLVSIAVMLLFALIFCIVRGYKSVTLFVIYLLVVYKAVDALSEYFYAVLQRHHRLDQVGKSLSLKAFLGVFVFVSIDFFTRNLVLTVLCLVILNLVIMFVYDFRMAKQIGLVLDRPEKQNVFKLFRTGFATFIVALLTQYLLNSPKYAIDTSLSQDQQAVYGIISMPASFMVLISNLLVHPALTTLHDHLLAGRKHALTSLVTALGFSMLFIGVLAVGLGFLLGVPVFKLLYNLDTSLYVFDLVRILVGATLFGLAFIFSTVLITFRKTRSQAVVFISISLLSFFLNQSLIRASGISGGTYAYLITMALLAISYLCLYLYVLKMTKFNQKTTIHPNSSKSKLHVFVVLAYQESKYLERCIQSVIRQGATSDVILFTTTPNKHIKRLADKYQLTLKTGTHTSIGGDFDAALHAGERYHFVTIAHQDDIYNKNYAKKILHAAKTYPDPDSIQIVFSDYYEIRNGKKEYSNLNLKIKRILLSPLRLNFFNDSVWKKRLVLRFGDPLCCPAVTFNMRTIAPPLFRSEMNCDVDWLAWERLSKKPGAFIYLNQSLVGHRVHAGSETSKTLSTNSRIEEDETMFRKFWPAPIAKILTKLYKKSEKSNDLSKK